MQRIFAISTASCQSGAFLCSNGQCIRSSDRCDGTRECTDGGDETGCSKLPSHVTLIIISDCFQFTAVGDICEQYC